MASGFGGFFVGGGVPLDQWMCGSTRMKPVLAQPGRYVLFGTLRSQVRGGACHLIQFPHWASGRLAVACRAAGQAGQEINNRSFGQGSASLGVSGLGSPAKSKPGRIFPSNHGALLLFVRGWRAAQQRVGVLANWLWVEIRLFLRLLGGLGVLIQAFGPTTGCSQCKAGSFLTPFSSCRMLVRICWLLVGLKSQFLSQDTACNLIWPYMG